MSRIKPLTDNELGDATKAALDSATKMLGFESNDAKVVARNPALMAALGGLVGATYAPGKVDPGLKRLVGLITSNAAGCTYCTGHTAFTSRSHGVSEEKLRAVWDFETSDLYDEAERAALRIALHAGQVPSGVTDEMFRALDAYYDEAAQLEIVAVIALFGYLNRLNSTLATELESRPRKALDELTAS